MIRVTVLAGLVIAMAPLPTIAEFSGGSSITNWDFSVPAVSGYGRQPAGEPLTGAARFHAGQPVESLTVYEPRFMASPRIAPDRRNIPAMDAHQMAPDFGPGPELVAPAPTQVQKLRLPR